MRKFNNRIVKTSAIHISGFEHFELRSKCPCTVTLHEPYGYIYFNKHARESYKEGISLSLSKITNIRSYTEKEYKSAFSWTDYAMAKSTIGSIAGLIFAEKKKPVKNILVIEYFSHGRKCSVTLKGKDYKSFKKFQDALYDIRRYNKKLYGR